MGSYGPDLERGWWLSRQVRDEQGEWDVTVQLRDGRAIELHLLPAVDFEHVLAAAVAAWLAGDVRRSNRGGRGGS